MKTSTLIPLLVIALIAAGIYEFDCWRKTSALVDNTTARSENSEDTDSSEGDTQKGITSLTIAAKDDLKKIANRITGKKAEPKPYTFLHQKGPLSVFGTQHIYHRGSDLSALQTMTVGEAGLTDVPVWNDFGNHAEGVVLDTDAKVAVSGGYIWLISGGCHNRIVRQCVEKAAPVAKLPPPCAPPVAPKPCYVWNCGCIREFPGGRGRILKYTWEGRQIINGKLGEPYIQKRYEPTPEGLAELLREHPEAGHHHAAQPVQTERGVVYYPPQPRRFRQPNQGGSNGLMQVGEKFVGTVITQGMQHIRW